MFANERTGSQDGDTIRYRDDFLGRLPAGESSPERAVDDDQSKALRGSRQVCSDEVMVLRKGLADELGKRTQAEEVIIAEVWRPAGTSAPKGEIAVHH